MNLGNKYISIPSFLPDATYGVVKAVDSFDLVSCNISAVVMNTFHLMQRPGTSTIKSLGGLHKMSNWPGVIITDSGGFQAYSLIHNNPKAGSISNNGILYRPETAKSRLLLTPEKTILLQFGYGSDVIYCLDDCTHPDAPQDQQELAVSRTINWAKKGKIEYLKLLNEKKIEDKNRPSLFAVIQGGRSFELRKQCADELQEIGFDGYGYGGWPIDNSGNLLEDLLSYVREIILTDLPLHALGVGHPLNIVKAYLLGWQLFDSALPTRDARRGRLYAFTEINTSINVYNNNWFDIAYVIDEKFTKSSTPVSPGCTCLSCQQYSIGYLHHLQKLDDPLYYRLSTIHNLHFINDLCHILQNANE